MVTAIGHHPLHAEWRVVDDFTQSGSKIEMLDNTKQVEKRAFNINSEGEKDV